MAGALVGILPKALAVPFARLEPYGLVILIALLIVLPLLGAQLGVDLRIVSQFLAISTGAIIKTILFLPATRRRPTQPSLGGVLRAL